MKISEAIEAMQAGAAVTHPALADKGRMLWLDKSEDNHGQGTLLTGALGGDKNPGNAMIWHPEQMDVLRTDYILVEG